MSYRPPTSHLAGPGAQAPRWKYLKIPEHLHYFFPRTLRRLLTSVGLQPIAVRRETETTGALNALCGGQAQAQAFYERWSQHAWFRGLVAGVHALKETFSGRVLQDFDNLTFVACKPAAGSTRWGRSP